MKNDEGTGFPSSAEEIDQTFRVVPDKDGNFVPQEIKQTAEKILQKEKRPYTSETASVKGAMDAMSQYVEFERKKSTADDDTLVDVKVHNPFHRILKMLQDIKTHQSTTVSMRFTIPLIALPIVLLAAFQLGRAQTVCASRFTSEIGTIKVLRVMVPLEKTDMYSQLLAFFPDIPKVLKKEDLTPAIRTILVTASGEILTVLHDNKQDFSPYNNLKVILSGNLSPCSSIITLDSEKNITVSN